MEGIRLNKFLSEAGICSRREADRLIEAGEVTVDGRAVGMGWRVTGSEVIRCRGRRVQKEERPVLLAFHKPRGIVCTAEKKEKNNVVDYVNYPVRIYPVGRLDKESQGLLLLTNRGELVNKIMRAGNYHEKEYWVSVDKPVTGEFLQKMSQGVYLKELGQTTRPCRVKKVGPNSFTMILTQGLNRQIRRMCRTFGYEVRRLTRTRIMNITLGDLPEGQYREITGEELRKLEELTADSPAQKERE